MSKTMKSFCFIKSINSAIKINTNEIKFYVNINVLYDVHEYY